MSNIYDALHSAHEKRLAAANELNDQPTPSLPHPLKGNSPPPTPRFHEESELRGLAQTIATLLPNPNQRVIQFIGSHAGEGTSTLIREFALTVVQHSSKPVLLIEADSNQPSQAQAFAMETKPPLDYVLKEGKPLKGVLGS